jgi:hypothetical protein
MHANYPRTGPAIPGNCSPSPIEHQQNFFTHPQVVTGHQKHRDPRFPPYAFTEHGAIMAATVLNSPRAVEMSVYVVRAFVRLRELLASNTALARKLDELERKYQYHDQGHPLGHPRADEPAGTQAPPHRIYRRSRGEEVPVVPGGPVGSWVSPLVAHFAVITHE